MNKKNILIIDLQVLKLNDVKILFYFAIICNRFNCIFNLITSKYKKYIFELIRFQNVWGQ